MIGSYSYSPDIWPTAIAAGLLALLGLYIWSRRDIAGARPLAFAALFGVLWITGLLLEGAAEETSTKIFWFEFQGLWQLPLGTAIFLFVVQYSGLGYWLTKSRVTWLIIPSFLVAAIILTNNLHHLMWQSFQVNETVIAPRGPAYWLALAFALILAVIGLVILGRLFIRSPRHRWPVALMVVGQVANRVFVVMDSQKLNLPGSIDPIVFMFGFAFVTYTIALFRFHILDPVPLARAVVMDQMREAMLVLNTEWLVVDSNKAAAEIFNPLGIKLKGQLIDSVLPVKLDQLIVQAKAASYETDISLGSGPGIRHFNLSLAPLSDRRGTLVGQTLFLRDITQEKLARAELIEQQKVTAMLEERERLARELHDGVAQVVGYMGMQAQAVRKLVSEANFKKADSILGRLIDVAKDAHADIRESILNLRSNPTQDWSFIPVVKQYLQNFQANYGIRADLCLIEPEEKISIKPIAGVQLLRVIQEALTNSRKHGNAQNIKVTIQATDHRYLINVADDGCGFDIKHLEQQSGNHLGLVLMRERMKVIKGAMAIDSMPGNGTVVKLELPGTA
ncbi:MAG: histidine kinase N-terminal 7TM domain-containing protein [Dehalogenimonas sp.]